MTPRNLGQPAASDYNRVNIAAVPMENKTARLTVLIDPGKKTAFEKLCYSQDMTPSQVMRRLIREFMEQHAPVGPATRKSADGHGSRASRKRGG